MSADPTPRVLTREERRQRFAVMMQLHPMGVHTICDENGAAIGSACGEFNQPPYVPGIRKELQWANEAGTDPAWLYAEAVAAYEKLDIERRRDHPEWTWPAPPFEAVEPATWPTLKPEVQRAVHSVRVLSALADHDEADVVGRLRRILRRAHQCGLDPEALYRETVARYVASGLDVDRRHLCDHVRRPALSYEQVAPVGGRPDSQAV
jgi:hypothetical protein